MIAGRLLGDLALQRQFDALRASTRRRLTGGAVMAGGRRLAAAVKAVMRSRSYKRLVNARRGKALDGSPAAKVGFVKGRARKPKGERVKGQHGITEKTIHWFVLGTGQRETEEGESRGAMPPQVEPQTVLRAAEGAASAALAAMRENLITGLRREAAKMAAKVRAAR